MKAGTNTGQCINTISGWSMYMQNDSTTIRYPFFVCLGVSVTGDIRKGVDWSEVVPVSSSGELFKYLQSVGVRSTDIVNVIRLLTTFNTSVTLGSDAILCAFRTPSVAFEVDPIVLEPDDMPPVHKGAFTVEVKKKSFIPFFGKSS